MDKGVSDFIIKYKQEFPIEYWDEKVRELVGKFQKAKKADPFLQSYNPVDLYALYLQLVEISIMTLRCFTDSPSNFMATLFGDGNVLINTANQLKNDTQLRDKQIARLLGLNSKRSVYRHSELLRKVVDDYTCDRQLLNSYKHGFRVQIGHPFTNVEVETQPGKWMSVGNTNKTLVYYQKKKTSDTSHDIYEREVGFHPEQLIYRLRFTNHILTAIIKSQHGPFLINQPETPSIDFIRTQKLVFGATKNTLR